MSIRKRGKYWIVDVCDGARRLRRSARSLRQARQVEAGLRQELAAGKTFEHGLEAALLRYIDHELPTQKGRRWQAYRCKYLRPFLIDRAFDDVADVAQEIRAELLPQGYAPATINRLLALLRRLCSLAFKQWGWIDRPVAQRVGLLPEHNERHVYLTVEQVDLLAGECRGPEGKAVRLLAYTGMRRGELFALLRGEAEIRDDCIVLGAGTKSGRPRVIPVHPNIRAIVDELPLPITEQTLRTEFEGARVRVGLPHVRIHDLRHTMASWLAQAGVSLLTIGDLLGHSQASTTRRYAHLSVEALRAAVERLK